MLVGGSLVGTAGPSRAPGPHRGAVAHPGHVPHIARKIAEVKGVGHAEVFARCRGEHSEDLRLLMRHRL